VKATINSEIFGSLHLNKLKRIAETNWELRERKQLLLAQLLIANYLGKITKTNCKLS